MLLNFRNWQAKSTIQVYEHLTNKLIDLKRDLTETKESRLSTLPHEYPQLLDGFILNQHSSLSLPELSSPKLVKWLEVHNKPVFLEFSQYLYDSLESQNLPGAGYTEYPSWTYFDSPTVIKNQWLIHFTEEAREIADHGFRWGVDDPNRLGVTTFLGQEHKSRGGYNFAFLASDFLDYYERPSAYGPMPKYGLSAVLFRASGIQVWHKGDLESQVIFYGSSATDRVPITWAKGGNWTISSKREDRTLFKSRDLAQVVDWVILNHRQYARVI